MTIFNILLFVISLLVVLCGLVIYFGSIKTDRKNTAWLLFPTIGMAIFSASIITINVTKISMIGIYLGIILALIGLLFYAGRKNKIGIILAISFGLIGIVMLALLLSNFNVIYGPNGYIFQVNWTYLFYATYCILGLLVLCEELLMQIIRINSSKEKIGRMIVLTSLFLSGIAIIIFDIILPMENSNLAFIGPLTLIGPVVAFYYTILKFDIIQLKANFLKVLSYIVLVALGSMIYILLFYLAFTFLFKIPDPSFSMLLLNLIMASIVLILVSIANETMDSIKTIIYAQDIGLARITKKLNQLEQKNISFDKLAFFIAYQLNFEFVILEIDGKVFSSDKNLKISDANLKVITNIKNPENSVWKKPDNENSKNVFDVLNISAVAELRDAKGKAFGQIIIGKPQKRRKYSRRNLLQLEMIINLIAAMIESKKIVAPHHSKNNY